MDNLEKLLNLNGVSSEYLDYSGERIVVPRDVRVKCLETLDYDVSSDDAIQQAVYQLDALPWKSWLQPFNIISQEKTESFDLRVHPDERSMEFNWEITTGQGESFNGKLIPENLTEVGEYYIDGVRYSAHRLPMRHIAVGYHQIRVWNQQREEQAIIAVAPPRCFDSVQQPGNDDSNLHQERLQGISCQLYTLRSDRNWGIGDFTDLMELVTYCARAKLDFIVLNPLPAPHLTGADFASPYSPSDRRFLNPLYIDPERVEDFQDSKNICQRFNSKAVQKKLAELTASEWVDYDGVAALKYAIFDEMFQHFVQQHVDLHTVRADQFHHFVSDRGESLLAFSEFESHQSGLQLPGARDPRFHQYLQWVCDEQLGRCQESALSGGMTIGLMRDLPVGAVKGGAEIETNSGLFCHRATIGAPPDPFTRYGQDWGLPTLNPIGLRGNNYQHFITLLRANMNHCGALRIDHVMGLLRQWWCLSGVEGGVYVYFPLDILLAILCIESHLNNCLIVGEDMGVVPDELRARMAATAIYGNKLFYFERDHVQNFKQPHEYPHDVLLMVTNHDVSTLAGWWQGTDLKIRKEIGFLDAEGDHGVLLRERMEDKKRLFQWLRSQQLIPESWADFNNDMPVKEDRPFDLDLFEAILKGIIYESAQKRLTPWALSCKLYL